MNLENLVTGLQSATQPPRKGAMCWMLVREYCFEKRPDKQENRSGLYCKKQGYFRMG